MQIFGQGKPPVGIVFDTGMTRIDDALALSMLYGFEGRNECRLVSVSVSRPNLNAAVFCDAIGHFYAGPVSGAIFSFSRTLPTGLADSGGPREDLPLTAVPLSRKKDDGTPAYANGIAKLNDTAEVPALIRNALTAQYDQNAIVVLTGPATNLIRTLDLHDARDWIQRKVQFLVVADVGVESDAASAKKLFAEWPTPIISVGREIGEALPYPASSVESDFAWSPAHPVIDAYRAYKPMPYDAPAWDLAAVLYAVRPKEGYFQLSPVANRRKLVYDPAQKERVQKTYTEIVSAKPAPKRLRFRPPKKDAEPVKKEEAKPEAK